VAVLILVVLVQISGREEHALSGVFTRKVRVVVRTHPVLPVSIGVEASDRWILFNIFPDVTSGRAPGCSTLLERRGF
jgi:hypothetical protein